MFGIRTPVGKQIAPPNREASPEVTPNASPAQPAKTNVRRSIEVLEAVHTPLSSSVPAAPAKPKKVAILKSTPPAPLAGATEGPKTSTSVSRVQEARNWVTKAKIALGQSRNLRTDIKEDVTQALDTLYRMVRDGEADRGRGSATKKKEQSVTVDAVPTERCSQEYSRLLSSLADHSKLVRESTEKMEELKSSLTKHSSTLETTTYAGVLAAPKPLAAPRRLGHLCESRGARVAAEPSSGFAAFLRPRTYSPGLTLRPAALGSSLGGGSLHGLHTLRASPSERRSRRTPQPLRRVSAARGGRRIFRWEAPRKASTRGMTMLPHLGACRSRTMRLDLLVADAHLPSWCGAGATSWLPHLWAAASLLLLTQAATCRRRSDSPHLLGWVTKFQLSSRALTLH
uniref:Uncharacterized protein n=1 Tax=Heliothis virescens TaxID=7102 RepID=A0A2A4J3W4_HELVI